MRNGTTIREEKENVLIRAGDFSVTVLPRFGGKISSIRFNELELLQAPLRPLQPRTPTMPFDAADASGWDECLPSVAACTVETSSGLVRVPDHGDVWRVEWEEQATGQRNKHIETVALKAKCFSLPLQLSRQLAVRKSKNAWRIDLEYTIENVSKTPTLWSWSAHPLFAVQAGDQIRLPETIKTLRLEGSAGDRLGRSGARIGWPKHSVNGTKADLNVVQPKETGIGDKLFAGPLTAEESWCTLLRAAAGLQIKMSFDPAATPYLGLWLCYGGWPEGPGPKQMCVAFEPATAPVDSLAQTGTWSRTLGGGESYSWAFGVEFEKV